MGFRACRRRTRGWSPSIAVVKRHRCPWWMVWVASTATDEGLNNLRRVGRAHQGVGYGDRSVSFLRSVALRSTSSRISRRINRQRLTDDEGSPGVERDVELLHEHWSMTDQKLLEMYTATYSRFHRDQNAANLPKYGRRTSAQHSSCWDFAWLEDGRWTRSFSGWREGERRKQRRGPAKTHPSGGRGDVVRGKVRPQGLGWWIRSLHRPHVQFSVRPTGVRMKYR